MHTHAPLPTHGIWKENKGSDHLASTYPSGRCSPQYVDLCTCSKYNLKNRGRKREKVLLFTDRKKGIPSPPPYATFLIIILRRNQSHHEITAYETKYRQKRTIIAAQITFQGWTGLVLNTT